ncbi:Maf family protein [Xylanimonas cellulosilytica]|uniref:Maf family protein n=1 Tax=Xylanimonas cellulosilytica TaxID=186189 RepID=UPI00019C107E|nr:Maf family protein [Xylanimonas cellulosilytica]
MASVHLVLASQSPARLSTLRSAGVQPTVVVSGVDEDAVLAAAGERFGALEPADAVLLLAQAKAEDVARRIEDEEATADMLGVRVAEAVVVGCDSMLELDGEILGKPLDADDAVARWQAMRGKAGVLHTGHWLVDLRDGGVGGTGATLGATSSTVCHFADIDDDEIRAYVATGEPLRVAGAYTIDGLGGPYIDRVEGDHHGVVGISLPLLRELLGEIDVPWRSLRD